MVLIRTFTRAVVIVWTILFFGEKSEAACNPPKTPLELVRCISENHPTVKLSQAEVNQAETLPNIARQRAIPELAAEGSMAPPLSGKSYEAEVALLHTIELGEKRSSRIAFSLVKAEQAVINRDQAKIEAALHGILKLHRLRQLRVEQALLQEALDTFQRLTVKYDRRPRLTPEQEVSASVFEMAHADYVLRLSSLFEEETALEKYFLTVAELPLSLVRGLLPEAMNPWPTVHMHQERWKEAGGSFELEGMRAAVRLAQADVQSAKAALYPDLTLGPMMKFQGDGRASQQFYGLQLSIPLPIYQSNSAGLSYAAAGLSRAESNVAVQVMEEEREYHELQKLYRSMVEVIQKIPTRADLEKKHVRVEKLFAQGLVSGALVIEAHRQAIELEQTRNQRELRAIDCLLHLRKLSRTLLLDATLKEVL